MSKRLHASMRAGPRGRNLRPRSQRPSATESQPPTHRADLNDFPDDDATDNDGALNERSEPPPVGRATNGAPEAAPIGGRPASYVAEVVSTKPTGGAVSSANETDMLARDRSSSRKLGLSRYRLRPLRRRTPTTARRNGRRTLPAAERSRAGSKRRTARRRFRLRRVASPTIRPAGEPGSRPKAPTQHGDLDFEGQSGPDTRRRGGRGRRPEEDFDAASITGQFFRSDSLMSPQIEVVETDELFRSGPSRRRRRWPAGHNCVSSSPGSCRSPA